MLVPALLALLAPCAGAAADDPQANPPGTPNVLILYADDLGYGDVGATNPASKIPTPHLDRLAAEGLTFTDAHSSSGICTPSRYALLTGRHHWRDFHGIVNSFGGSVFEDGQVTLASLLKENGYRTACIGKWHLGWDWEAIRNPAVGPLGKGRQKGLPPEAFDWSKPIPGGPLAVGFDRYFGDTVINFPPYAWIEDDRVTQAPTVMKDESTWPPIKEGNWECRPGPMVEGWNPYDVLPTLADRGVQYLQEQAEADEPFFLYFAFPSPHAPIIPNDKFDGASQAGPYGDFVHETDHVVGRLLAALEESGQAANTLVVFTADNGPERYAYAREQAFDHWSAAPFRGLKRDIHEGGHHVPFFVRWPGVTEPGATTDALTSQVDLFATIAEATGAALPPNAAAAEGARYQDSVSLMPVLKGAPTSGRTTIVQNTNPNAYAFRQGDRLLINAKTGHHSGVDPKWLEKHDTPREQGDVHLYNLAEDVGQQRDLAAERPDETAEMQAALQRARRPIPRVLTPTGR
ncbi:sulfatase family protein [Alienimonas californiensis]|uniref:Arylsulfatase n=1 Tax=Alienimonas californiensis TaxID=2527989 RepID=A0A517P4W0_9PLAN|nr:arylsulfatase [Alienimonas californiensis]QDT14385.1 Arylsulfatase [Alienimonas californiensis]